jgi:hypothetical protein
MQPVAAKRLAYETERVLCARSVARSYKEDDWGKRVSSLREAVILWGSWKGAVIQRGLERGN